MNNNWMGLVEIKSSREDKGYENRRGEHFLEREEVVINIMHCQAREYRFVEKINLVSRFESDGEVTAVKAAHKFRVKKQCSGKNEMDRAIRRDENNRYEE